MWRLIWSDYESHYQYKEDPPWKMALLAVPRIASNASLHANVLVRLTVSGPELTAGLFRRLLFLTHRCDISPVAKIGPGLRINHPLGITLGPRVSIGRDVALFHGTTLRAGSTGWLRVEDDVEIFTGAVISGSITVGSRSVVGANVVLDTDLGPGEAFTFSHCSSVCGE